MVFFFPLALLADGSSVMQLVKLVKLLVKPVKQIVKVVKQLVEQLLWRSALLIRASSSQAAVRGELPWRSALLADGPSVTVALLLLLPLLLLLLYF